MALASRRNFTVKHVLRQSSLYNDGVKYKVCKNCGILWMRNRPQVWYKGKLLNPRIAKKCKAQYKLFKKNYHGPNIASI
jgi:hypothetical protein